MLKQMLNENTWAQGVDAVDQNGKVVSWDSPNAVRRDITSTLRYIYDDDKELVSEAIFNIKSVINTDPILSAVMPDKYKYEDEFGKIFEEGSDVWPKMPLYVINDELSVNELQRLLILVD